MSGHSKWSQIKHKKGISDQKKGQVFSKLAKAIAVAAKNGSDPASNMTLKGLIEQARVANMPSASIERAIKKASEKDSEQLREFQLEMLASGNIAVIVRGITDNTNRTLGELKTIASKHGAKVASQGSLSWMFDKNTMEPQYRVPVANPDKFQELMEAINDNDDVQSIHTNAE